MVAAARLATAETQAGLRHTARKNKRTSMGTEAPAADQPMLCATGV
jgi:hypothetical protein